MGLKWVKLEFTDSRRTYGLLMGTEMTGFHMINGQTCRLVICYIIYGSYYLQFIIFSRMIYSDSFCCKVVESRNHYFYMYLGQFRSIFELFRVEVKDRKRFSCQN